MTSDSARSLNHAAVRRKVPLGFALPWTPDMRRKLAAVTADDILRARRLWWQVVKYPLHALLEAKPE